MHIPEAWIIDGILRHQKEREEEDRRSWDRQTSVDVPEPPPRPPTAQPDRDVVVTIDEYRC